MVAWQGLVVEFSPGTNPDDEPVWWEITDDVIEIQTHIGRSDELSLFSAGTASIKLRNDSRQYDPSNTESVWYPNLVPKRKMRVRCGIDRPLFMGDVEGWPQEIQYRENRAFCEVDLIDAFESLESISIHDCFWTHETIRELSKVAWYRFKDENNQFDGVTYLTDVTGYQANGIYSPRGSDLQFGSSIVRGGSSWSPNGDTWVILPDHNYWPNDSEFTVEGFFKFSKVPAGGTEPEGRHILGNNYFSVFVYDSDDIAFGPGRLNVRLDAYRTSIGAFESRTCTSLKDVCDDRWHHYVVTYDSPFLRLFVDGVLESSAQYSETVILALPTESMRFGRGSDVGGLLVLPSSAQIGEHVFYGAAKDLFWAGDRYQTLLGFPGESNSDRVDRLLDLAGWNVSLRSVEESDGLAPADASGTVLGALQAVTEAEQGLFFIDQAGVATFVRRSYYLRSNAVALYFSDLDDGSARYVDARIVQDPQFIFNDAQVSRRGSDVSFHAENLASITKYRRRSTSKSGLALYSDYDAKGLAEWIVLNGSEPKDRIDLLRIDLRLGDPLLSQVLDLEIGDRINVIRHPLNTGSEWDVTGLIDSITHDISLEERTWIVSLKMSPVPNEDILVLDDPVRDNLDTHKLGF